jgi:rfaE bifunctional protein nucleotidyltransferase chain/domain
MISHEAVDFLRNVQGRIVFTNGCFDVIHCGHVNYLNLAKKEGDVLFVGLNSDASVQRLKGTDRPINKQDDRKFILENLKAVDFVEIFDEDTPLELIKIVRPQLLVKGGDWNIDHIVGREVVVSYGGVVKVIPVLKGYSSTKLIERIKSL